MAIPVASKKSWKRIIVLDTDLSDSDDDVIPCKLVKRTVKDKHIQSQNDSRSAQKREYITSTDVVHVSNSPVLKRRRSRPTVIPHIVFKGFPFLHPHEHTKISAIYTHGGTPDDILLLSRLLPHQTQTDLTVYCNTLTENSEDLLRCLVAFICEVTRRNLHKETLPSKVKFLIECNRRAVWASWTTILNLLFLNPLECRIFDQALRSVIKFCQNLGTSICSITYLVDKIILDHDFIKTGTEALYEDLVSLTFFINDLLIKKNLSREAEGLLVLALDIALLPLVGNDVAKRQKRCLYLVRSILKTYKVCWQICIPKVYSVTFHHSSWNKCLSPCESGKLVNKSTLLLLTLIQSSVELPEEYTNARDFFQSLQSSDLKYILSRLQDDPEEQNTEMVCLALQKVLYNANYIIWYLFSKFEQDLLKSNLASEYFGRFLQDLLVLMDDFQWPAAEYVLITLCNFAVKSLKKAKLPKPSCKFLVNCLGDIFVEVNRRFSSPVRSFGCVQNGRNLNDSWEMFSTDEQEVDNAESLLFLQSALLAYLVRQCKNNLSSQDKCLFYLADWFDDRNEEEWEAKDDLIQVDWNRAIKFVNPLNINEVVVRIMILRRTAEFKNIFYEVVNLRRSKDKSLSNYVMELVFRLCNSNSTIFVEEEVVKEIISCQRNDCPVDRRRSVVRCLTAYLFHCPEQIDFYKSVLNSYIADEDDNCVRNAAVHGMKEIGLKCYNNQSILKWCLLLLKTDQCYSDSAAQYFCKITWLKPVRPDDEELLERKVSMLINMFALIDNSSFIEEVFPDLFRLDTKNERTFRQQVKVCEQIVDVLARRCLEGCCVRLAIDNRKVVASFKLLHLFAKITPKPLVPKCAPLWMCHRLLSEVILPAVDVIVTTSKSIVAVLPHVDVDSEDLSWVPDFQMNSFVVANRFNRSAIVSGLNGVCSAMEVCGNQSLLDLSAAALCSFEMTAHRFAEKHGDGQGESRLIGRLLLTIGVFLKNLDIGAWNEDVIRAIGFEIVKYCRRDYCDEVRAYASFALCNLCLRYHREILAKKVKRFYLKVFRSVADGSSCLLIQVLRTVYEFVRLLLEYRKESIHEDRKPPLTDLSGETPAEDRVRQTVRDIAKAVLDVYFKAATARYFHPDKRVRFAVFELVVVAQRHRVLKNEEIIPLLATMTCDPEKHISARAKRELLVLDKEDPLCISECAAADALTMSRALSRVTSDNRGYSVEEDGTPTAKTHVLYSVILKSTNCAYLTSQVMKMFKKKGTCVFDLLFYADNLVYFDFKKRMHVIVIIRHIDEIVTSEAFSAKKCFKKILRKSLDESWQTSLRIHDRPISDALRMVLLLEMRAFLVKFYVLQQVELEKCESNKPYRIEITFNNKRVYVSNRSSASRISKISSKQLFTPMISVAEIVEGNMPCCGWELSRETLIMFYGELNSLLKKWVCKV